MPELKLIKSQCDQTGMVQATTMETSGRLHPFYGTATGISESGSSLGSLPQLAADAMVSCQVSFQSRKNNTLHQYEFGDFHGRRKKRTENEMITELQKQINQLKTEVTGLKQRQNSEVKIHYIEIVELPFDEVKKQVLEYYNKNGENYPDDIAADLRLDLKTVMKAVQELIHEGKLQLAI